MIKRIIHELARPFLEPFYRGVGTILELHRLLCPPGGPRAGWVRELETRPEWLEALVHDLRRRGDTFVSIDELHEALVRRTTGRARLVVVTFDDGYRDVLDTALPLCRSLGVPFVAYVVTDYLDRRRAPWWCLLERALTRPGSADLEIGGVRAHLPLGSQEERDATFTRIQKLFAAGEGDTTERVCAVFGEREARCACEELFLTWADVKALAACPLVTIGSHTVSHPVLSRLPAQEALLEMTESRLRIEEAIGAPVRHLAYPFGAPPHAGPREMKLARAAGYATAVTTRVANIFPGSRDHLLALPRTCGRTPREIDLAMSGVVSAFRHRGRRVVLR